MKYISVERKENYCILKLNRAEKFNSFIRPMALELQKALDECESDSEIRAILLTAEGKAFCAGQDLNEAIDPAIKVDLHKIITEHYNPLIMRLTKIEKPIVCAVNGVAAGAGANVALACDIVIAAESAAFIQAFSKIGLIPDSGGTWILPRLVGLARAKALMMTAEAVTAKDAVAMGMIYKAVADDKLANEAEKLTASLAKMPTRGLGLTKRALNLGLNNSLKEQLTHEWRLQSEAGGTDDFKEGVVAFLEKRKPEFTGK